VAVLGGAARTYDEAQRSAAAKMGVCEYAALATHDYTATQWDA